MVIVGAGMAGLLAANMLRSRSSIMESAESLPNNHSAVLRFRTSVVSDVLGIEFRKVRVMRAVKSWRNPLADALSYSYKCNGVADLRSIAHADGSIVDRWVAPPDLIARMADMLPTGTICLGAPFTEAMMMDAARRREPVISTMPMPVAMKLLRWEGEQPDFRYRHGCNILVSLQDVAAWASLYVPDPTYLGSRVSLMGDQMVIECPGCDAEDMMKKDDQFGAVEEMVTEALAMVGLPGTCAKQYELRPQRYAKIMPINEQIRKNFIMWASTTFSFYSLGRFATWRPSLLLDDVVHDVRVIQRMIGGDAAPRYNARKE